MWCREKRDNERGWDILSSCWQWYCSTAWTGSPAEGPWYWLCTLGIYLFEAKLSYLYTSKYWGHCANLLIKKKVKGILFQSFPAPPQSSTLDVQGTLFNGSLTELQINPASGRYFRAQNNVSRQGHAACEESGNLDCTSLAAAQNVKEGWGKTDSVNT